MAAQHIFDARDNIRRGGTSLGLASSQRVANEHGGSSQVQTEAGKGSDCYLILPVE